MSYCEEVRAFRGLNGRAGGASPAAGLAEGEAELAELLGVDDRGVAENERFSYPLFLPAGRGRAQGLIILLHDLNERSWQKYLPWARALCEGTGRAAALFPLAFHDAGNSLRRFYGSGFSRRVARDARLARVFRGLGSAGSCFAGLLSGGGSRIRDARLRQIGTRISALALSRDTVAPGEEVNATLRGERGDIPVTVEVTDFPYAYSHENPFPAAAGCLA